MVLKIVSFLMLNECHFLLHFQSPKTKNTGTKPSGNKLLYCCLTELDQAEIAFLLDSTVETVVVALYRRIYSLILYYFKEQNSTEFWCEVRRLTKV